MPYLLSFKQTKKMHHHPDHRQSDVNIQLITGMQLTAQFQDIILCTLVLYSFLENCCVVIVNALDVILTVVKKGHIKSKASSALRLLHSTVYANICMSTHTSNLASAQAATHMHTIKGDVCTLKCAHAHTMRYTLKNSHPLTSLWSHTAGLP